MNIPRTIINLENMNIEFELAELFATEEQHVKNRIIILDDSFSMENKDGIIIDPKTRQPKYCKRSEEMMNIVTDCCKIYQARIISSGIDLDNSSFFEFNQYKNICDILEELDLNETNYIMIFTDCNPHYSRMINILREFQGKIVVRLCGNSTENYSYWKSVAFRLKKSKMTIVRNFYDDYNICSNINFSLNYKYSLHKVREMGINDQLVLDITSQELSDIQIDFIKYLTKKRIRYLCC